MFYERKPEFEIRFGDIVRPHASYSPGIIDPLIDISNNSLQVNLNFNKYLIVLTPCCTVKKRCSIGNVVSLTPLVKINPTIFSNPYFLKDLTNLNRRMSARQAVSPEVWERLTAELREKRERVGSGFGYCGNFIYEPHPSLPKYNIELDGKEREVGHYMIEFQNIYTQKIPREELLKGKVLQITNDTRFQLRDKLAYFFFRDPDAPTLD